jgi:hypothetical protein
MTPLWTRCTDLTAARGAALALLLCLPAGESQAQARPPSPLAPLTPQTPPLIAPAQAPEFIGCYKDTSDLDLNGHLERSAQNTPLRCSAICQSRGFAYAAVQYGESCLCGNSYGRYGPADNCNYACTGDRGQVCGGYSANSVYSVPRSAAPQPVPLCWPATIDSKGQCSDGGPPRR